MVTNKVKRFIMKVLLVLVFLFPFICVQSDRKLQGGRYAGYREFLYVVSVQDRQLEHHCTGVLLSTKIVATAGQCITNYDERIGVTLRDHRLYVVYVASRFTKEIEKGVYRDIKGWYVHPKLDFVLSLYWSNDIGIAVLTSEISADVATPVDEAILKKECVVIGWSWERSAWSPERDENSTSPLQLKAIEVNLRKKEECENQIKGVKVKYAFLNLTLLSPCVEPNTSTCFAEPGAPIVCDRAFAGISSWFAGCGIQKGTIVYTPAKEIFAFHKNLNYETNSTQKNYSILFIFTYFIFILK